MKFEPIIGLEVHAQLKTKTKIFCACSTKFGASPNTHVCPICLGMPGVLPVLNKKVVEFAILVALATNCTVVKQSSFARKNYFYPDLPKGYQISQYELPIAKQGYIEIALDKSIKKIGITRIHMEEDAGKLIHDAKLPYSKVDFNRTGVPLIEVVSEPDINSPEEASAYLIKLRSKLRYLDVCDGNMEEGSFRCDANVSIRPEGSNIFGTRTELKNLNSFKHVQKAILYEITRQKGILTEEGRVIQETRLWNSDKNISTSMRGKEDAHDYRYFPDPDLVPIVVDKKWIADLKNRLPELPDDRRKRFISQYCLPEYDADFLTAEKEIADYFEVCANIAKDAKQVSNWIMGSLSALLNTEKKRINSSPVSAKDLARLINLVEENVISVKIAKKVFGDMAQTKKSAKQIVKEKGLVQVSDEVVIKKIAARILMQNKEEVEAYKTGKTKLMGFFVGQVMKETKGKAAPKIVNQILAKLLAK